MKKEPKEKYILSIEDTERLINLYILPHYPTFRFRVRQSDISKSIYIDIQSSTCSKTARISDHYINQDIAYCYVSANTKKTKVLHYLTNILDMMQAKDLDRMLSGISTQ